MIFQTIQIISNYLGEGLCTLLVFDVIVCFYKCLIKGLVNFQLNTKSENNDNKHVGALIAMH